MKRLLLIYARLPILNSICAVLLLSLCAFSQADKNENNLKQRYADRRTGVTFDYYVIAGWTKAEQSVPQATRVAFSNLRLQAGVMVTHQETPDVQPVDLAQPGVFEAVVERMRASGRIQAIISSRLVTNALNGVKGVELVYTAAEKGFKGKIVTFFKRHEVYIVEIVAPDGEFERVSKEFADIIVQTLNF